MEVTVGTDAGSLAFEAPTLEVARLVASVTGWNVDCEPQEPGRVRITATRGKATINTSGSSVHEAAGKLIEAMTHE